jgi:hypothetical protein
MDLRLFATLLGAAFVSLAGIAESQEPERKLAPVWQADIRLQSGQTFEDQYHAPTLRIGDDGRVSLALMVREAGSKAALLGFDLITLAADGTVLHRARAAAAPEVGNADAYMHVLTLPRGDFLVARTTGPGAKVIELSRRGPDGTVQHTHRDTLRDDFVLLHDALVLDDGRLLVVLSVGPGPNDILWAMLFDGAGRLAAEHQARVLLGGGEWATRAYQLTRDLGPGRIAVLGNGVDRHPSRDVAGTSPPIVHWLLWFDLAQRVPVTTGPQIIGDGALECSAIASEGAALLGVRDVGRAERGITLVWLSDEQKLLRKRTYPPTETEDERCIVLRRDGSLVWLADRKLLAFDKAGEPIWHAMLPAGAKSVAAMPNGDIVAVHFAAGGIRVVRYAVQ